jgi:hypothetical protein
MPVQDASPLQLCMLFQILHLSFKCSPSQHSRCNYHENITVVARSLDKDELLHESKQDQLDATYSGLFHQLYLNMFRASLRPSSGE